ncbi:hypothetical protein F5I97DRAFT_14477 [Phlebopus sp. FC_14]|nr:hypothetical protein F5I97DRAFT_14477 [Phlebopus sp. FC_14]
MDVASDRAFKTWHPGEQAVQAIIQLPERVSISAIVNKLPEQHRIFHTSRLHYVPVTTLDAEGRPWASMLCSATGTPSFITSPSETSLRIRARLWPGDPILANLRQLGKDAFQKGKALASGLGLEPSTRRRNKFAGHVSSAEFSDYDLWLELAVSHALGLCPKYINIRSLMPYVHAAPRVVHEQMHLCEGDRLPQDVINFIHGADTAFLATSYKSKPEEESVHPSRVGTNHRGGRPGFVRVRPGDGRTLVLPNYAGNRMMNSLGNIYVTPLAGLVFPSFATGSILYVSGTAETLFGAPARKLMPHVNVVTTIYVTGFSFVDNALPLRELPDTTAERSPYSPPICYLSEEDPPDIPYDDVTLTLVRTRVHNDSLATFTFETSRPIEMRPSQNCVLDLSDFLRKRSHELLDWTEDAATQNDDCVRTWTVSVPPTPASPLVLSITMRIIKGGLITPILHRIAQHADGQHQGKENDVSALGIKARLRGIGGDLPIPHAIAACDGGRRLLWIAGGIGITPFLSLTRYVMGLSKRGYGVWDVVLVVSTREPDVMLGLLNDAFDGPDHSSQAQTRRTTEQLYDPVDLNFAIHVFSSHAHPHQGLSHSPSRSNVPRFASLSMHQGRIDDSGKLFGSVDAVDREVQICGPLPFVLNGMKSLSAAGVDPEHVRRERFTY